MRKTVPDASAILAALFREPGAGVIETHYEAGIVSSVNLSEAAAKLSDRGMPSIQAQELLSALSARTGDPPVRREAGLPGRCLARDDTVEGPVARRSGPSRTRSRGRRSRRHREQEVGRCLGNRGCRGRPCVMSTECVENSPPPAPDGGGMPSIRLATRLRSAGTGRHDDRLGRNEVHYHIGPGGTSSVSQTPCDGYRCVDDDGHQARPLSRACRTSLRDMVVFRRSRSRNMALPVDLAVLNSELGDLPDQVSGDALFPSYSCLRLRRTRAIFSIYRSSPICFRYSLPAGVRRYRCLLLRGLPGMVISIRLARKAGSR